MQLIILLQNLLQIVSRFSTLTPCTKRYAMLLTSTETDSTEIQSMTYSSHQRDIITKDHYILNRKRTGEQSFLRNSSFTVAIFNCIPCC